MLYYLKVKIFGPVRIATKQGLNIGSNPIIPTSINFGTEPYLINIGDDFYCSHNVTFLTHDGSVNVLRNLYSSYESMDFISPINIGNNVFLGSEVSVLAGSVIGDNIIVGAKSLVKGTLKSNSVYAGCPVRYICSIEEYFNKIQPNLIASKKMKPKKKKEYLLSLFGK